MIDLTPLDVRNKRGDFKKLLRGYDPQEVDTFLEMVSERLEDVVRDNVHLRDRVAALQQLSDSQTGRERAVQEALVTAQELRNEIKAAAQREAELVLAEARAEARNMRAQAEADVRERLREAERRLEAGRDALEDMERSRARFLKGFRQLLERELEDLEVEEGKVPLEERPIDMDLGRPKEPEAEGEEQPPLDASADDLAAKYRAEVESLFGDTLPGLGGPEGGDLFSRPEEPGDEDSRWG